LRGRFSIWRPPSHIASSFGVDDRALRVSDESVRRRRPAAGWRCSRTGSRSVHAVSLIGGYRSRRPASSARWRSLRPPNVLLGEIRQLCRLLVAFTLPTLRSASSMSKTFAVSSHGGGSSSSAAIDTLPALRSRLSCARSARISLALRSASMRWSGLRAGVARCSSSGSGVRCNRVQTGSGTGRRRASRPAASGCAASCGCRPGVPACERAAFRGIARRLSDSGSGSGPGVGARIAGSRVSRRMPERGSVRK
jgi:hypothetical protein